jgi:hypothetical protein
VIDKDAFEQWQAHPVTEAVMKALAKLAEANKQEWIALSWETGQADPLKLAALRASYDANKDLSELTFEEMEGYLDEHKRHSAD